MKVYTVTVEYRIDEKSVISTRVFSTPSNADEYIEEQKEFYKDLIDKCNEFKDERFYVYSNEEEKETLRIWIGEQYIDGEEKEQENHNDLIEALKTIQDYCKNTDCNDKDCVFNWKGDCMLKYKVPIDWKINEVKKIIL